MRSMKNFKETYKTNNYLEEYLEKKKNELNTLKPNSQNQKDLNSLTVNKIYTL